MIPSGAPDRFRAELDGIGHILRDQWLGVPRYQRSYAWDLEEVSLFWEDLNGSRRSDYFVGTIVLAPGPDSRMEIIDGQQRLATTALLMAAIRDHFASKGDKRAQTIEKRYLASESLQTGEPEPRLWLAEADDQFFRQEVVFGKSGGGSANTASSKRLAEAYGYLRGVVREQALEAGDDWDRHLLDWVTFLDERLRVILVRVGSDADAFVIFETLNDRGLELNISDLLKNYLYGRSRDRLDEANALWSEARSALEVDNQDEAFSSFIRHYWSSRSGATREKELYRSLRGRIVKSDDAIEFLSQLEKAAPLYSALLNARHDVWATQRLEREASTLLRLGVQQNRPLLLAALEVLPQEEIRALMIALVGWTVRGLVVGGIGGGTSERYYADAATSIRSGQLTDTAQLRTGLDQIIPGDAEFQQQFGLARVRNLRLTGYYLRAIEHQMSGDPDPALVSDAEEDEVFVLKILPARSNSADWPGFVQDEIASLSYRLGNAVLLEPDLAAGFGDAGWQGKRNIMKESRYLSTRSASESTEWTPAVLDQRQGSFADAALRLWPR